MTGFGQDQLRPDIIGIDHIYLVTAPALYPEYAPDYFAVYFSDPDGIRLEITNYRRERRQRHDDWPVVEL